ncbi:MAG TPA: glycosyltransferase [archaeon]|nr:glycosyltransferase [archaeon]
MLRKTAKRSYSSSNEKLNDKFLTGSSNLGKIEMKTQHIFDSPPSVSIIVPTFNEEKYIVSCLKSLKHQTYRGKYEIIVADGGSKDRTIDLAKKIADKIIVCDSSVGTARNYGAKASSGEILAFIDSDTVASPNWLSAIVEAMSIKDVVCVGGLTLPLGGSKMDYFLYKLASRKILKYSITLGIPMVPGFNCAYRRAPFFKIGGFDERRVLSEDTMLSLTIQRLGKIVYKEKMLAYTSIRRIKAQGHFHMLLLHTFNGLITLFFGRSLSKYPVIR